MYASIVRFFISTHSPARGLTPPSNGRKTYILDFNSQPRKGADRGRSRWRVDISNFNSQPRKGADDQGNLQNPQPQHFNSQPRKGADP